MAIHLTKARADDYDDVMAALNLFFGKGQEDAYKNILPAMWRRTDQDMGKHLLLKDDDTIVGVIGIYPYEVMIGKQKMRFATVGNVGTSPDYRNRGFMKRLVTEALAELNRQQIQVARLEGQRQRYNRYGFENAGKQITFQLYPKNIPTSHTVKVSFQTIAPDDQHALTVAQLLYAQNHIHVMRKDNRRFFDTMSAFNMIPTLALDEHQAPIGYLAVSSDGRTIAEHQACSPEWRHQMLQDWLVTHQLDSITFSTPPWSRDLIRRLTKHAETWTVSSPTMLLIKDWLAFAQALLEARKALTPIPCGKCLLHICGYGTLAFVDDTVTLSEEHPMIMLNELEATRFLCGSLPIDSICDIPPICQQYARALFPLPFGWCNQDRV